jgi:regulator of RNase E activity RraA
MGDGMAKAWIAAGAIGMVTSGGVRDLPGIIDQGFSVFAIARVIQHAALRWSAYGEPVEVGGISVRSGDLIHGDNGGCIVIPEPNHQHIVEACKLVNDFEKQAHVMIRRTDLNNAQKRAGMDKLSESFDRFFSPLR